MDYPTIIRVLQKATELHQSAFRLFGGFLDGNAHLANDVYAETMFFA